MANGISGKLCFPWVCPTAVSCNSENSGEPQLEQWGARVETVGAMGIGSDGEPEWEQL